jgi:aminoglycoside 3-N-acetyltransferase
MADRSILTALERLGIPREGVLLVHSAFKSFGREGHDADTVVRTLVDYMKPGTLLLPTMSWRFVKPDKPVFDELQTPSNTGILTEMFRTKYATQRSLHPTHSVAGCGRLVEELLGGHHLDETPCAGRSPFGLLASHDGRVLMLGISMDCCTLIHHVEEMTAPNLYVRPASERETYTCRDRQGREVTVSLRRHLFLPRDYWQFQDLLAAEGRFHVTMLDGIACRSFRAQDMVRIATGALKDRPDAIIAKPGQRYRMM